MGDREGGAFYPITGRTRGVHDDLLLSGTLCHRKR